MAQSFVAPAILAASGATGLGVLYIAEKNKQHQQESSQKQSLPIFEKNSHNNGGESFTQQLAV